jgi:hypothetical protein
VGQGQERVWVDDYECGEECVDEYVGDVLSGKGGREGEVNTIMKFTPTFRKDVRACVTFPDPTDNLMSWISKFTITFRIEVFACATLVRLPFL